MSGESPGSATGKSAGYSGTPLAKKLGIKAGHTLALGHAPALFEATLEGLPEGVRIVRVGRFDRVGRVGRPERMDVAVLFLTTQDQLLAELPLWAASLDPKGGLWLAYPKKTVAKGFAPLPTDLTFEFVQPAALALGLVDNKICAIDEVWTGLRFVVRLEHRAAWPPAELAAAAARNEAPVARTRKGKA